MVVRACAPAAGCDPFAPMPPSRREIVTDRLVLVPATVALARADLEDRDRFRVLLEAEVPGDWPPPLNDEASQRWTLEYLERHRDGVGWSLWYFLLRAADGHRRALGQGGFKGMPDLGGVVEIGYSVMEDDQRRGYAPEAVRALLAWAFSHPEVSAVIAHTLPELVPSIRVLEKCGFAFDGESTEDGMRVVRYRLPRPA